MSMEYLRQIREQEEQADKIKRDGLTESKQIVNAADDEAWDIVDRARSEADTLYKSILAEADEEAQVAYVKTIEHAHWECDMLLAQAEKNIDKAVSAIVRKVVN